MTTPILDQLTDLDARATPAPWAEFCESGHWWIESQAPDGGPDGTLVCSDSGTAFWIRAADVDVTIAARNALPELLRVARAAAAYRQAYDARMRDEIKGLAPTELDEKEQDLFAALAALENTPA